MKSQLNIWLVLDLVDKIFKKILEKILVCKDSSIAAIKEEVFRRLFLPLYLPIIALFVSTLVLFSKDRFDYKRFKGKIFISVFFLIVISEISTRYIGKEFLLLLFFILFPIFLICLSYLLIYKKTRKFD